MDIQDEIYYSLIGQLAPALSWVPNAFAPGEPCDESYARLIDARDRILEKLGVQDDPDLEIILAEMDVIQHTLCRAALNLRITP